MSSHTVPKQPASCPLTSEIDSLTKGPIPSTSMPVVQTDVLETVNHSDGKDSDKGSGQPRLIIDILSDDVLLYIFNLYRQALKYEYDICSWNLVRHGTWQWRTLVHVCQRWRYIIFAWPNQLDVWVGCKSVTDIVKVMDAWPTLPIAIWSQLDDEAPEENEIIAGLKHRDRLAAVELLDLTESQLERCATLMQESFPILQTLSLRCHAEIAPVLTDAFLGGSAPRLRKLNLYHVPFPSLSILLLNTKGLVDLHLEDIPSTGYISPDMLATCMSMLPKLECVGIIFLSQRSFPNLTNPHPPPAVSAVLPALVKFVFKGVSEYSEDLMARIDAPLLNHLSLEYFYQPIFNIPQVPQFIHHTKQLNRPNDANVEFGTSWDGDGDYFRFRLKSSKLVSRGIFFRGVSLKVQYDGADKQISLFEQFCTQCSSVLSDVEVLYLGFNHSPNDPWAEQGQQAPARLLKALHVFDALETLYIAGDPLLWTVADALGTVTPERAAEVLPMLHTISGQSKWGVPAVVETMSPFLDARWETDHPVEVEWWN